MYKYDFHLRDYRSKTGHLDYLHHAAYRALLDAYYDSEKPLPNNPGLCHRLALAFSDAERAAVDKMLLEFFTIGKDGTLHNKMADEQISKYMQFLEKQAQNGQKGGRPRNPGHNPEKTHGLILANPGHNPNHNPNETLSSSSSSSSSPSSSPPPPPTPTKKRTKGLRPGIEYGENFLKFWIAYPKKSKKPDAWEAWVYNSCDELLEQILSSLKWQSVSHDWTKEAGQFIPLPASYLNARRWEDEQVVPVGAAGIPLAKLGRFGQEAMVAGNDWLESRKRKEEAGE